MKNKINIFIVSISVLFLSGFEQSTIIQFDKNLEIAPVKAQNQELNISENAKFTYTLDEEKFFKDYLDFKTIDNKSEKSADKLIKSILKIIDTSKSELVSDALVDIATVKIDNDRHRKASELIGIAKKYNLKNNLINKYKIAELKIAEMKILLLEREYLAAFEKSLEALKGYGAPEGFEDKSWASLKAWQNTTAMVALTKTTNKNYMKNVLSQIHMKYMGTDLFNKYSSSYFGASNCSLIDSIERDLKYGNDINYPSVALRRGFVGSSIVHVKLNQDGTVDNVKIIASVNTVNTTTAVTASNYMTYLPKKQFEEEIVKGIKTWKYLNTNNISQECLNNYIIEPQFYIEQSLVY